MCAHTTYTYTHAHDETQGLSFALPLASHVADPVYFFAYTDDGSLSLSCDALESSAVIEVQTGVCPTALSFLAVYEGLAGRGRVIGKAYRSFKALFSDRSSPEVHFARTLITSAPLTAT